MSDELDTSNFVSGEQENGAAPADPPVETETVETNAEATEEVEQTEEQKAEAAKPKKDFQSRIDEVTRARREAEREAKYWKDVAEGRVRPEPQNQREAEGSKAPDPNAYDLGDMDPRYIDDLVNFRVQQGLDKVMPAVAQNLQRQAGERVWEAAQEAARSKFDDYDEKVTVGAQNGDWPCSPEMAEAIKTSDAGGDLAYHLASNPDEARRIAALSPIAQIRELGRIEARLEAPASKPQAKTATDAPKPATTQARGAGGQFSPSPETDDFSSFESTYAAKW